MTKYGNKFVHLSVGDKLYIEWGETIYDGVITEVEKDGIWLTEDGGKTGEFLSFADLDESIDYMKWTEYTEE